MGLLRDIAGSCEAMHGDLAVATRSNAEALKNATDTVAELTALLKFLEGTRGAVHFTTDSAFVERGWNRIRARLPLRGKPHADLWGRVRDLAEGRSVTIVKIESHVDEQRTLPVVA